MDVFVDESARTDPPGLYVIAGVSVSDEAHESLRASIRAITPGRRRFHWHSEERRERQAAIDLLQDHRIGLLWSIEVSPCSPRGQERARRKALEQLFVTLAFSGGGNLVIESRQARNDARDRAFLGTMRHLHLPGTMRYEHRTARSECLLWLADALAGAVAAEVWGRDPGFVRSLGSRLHRQRLSP